MFDKLLNKGAAPVAAAAPQRAGAPSAPGASEPELQAWRDRMSVRPAVRQVAGAMGRYLLSQGRKLPTFLAKLSA